MLLSSSASISVASALVMPWSITHGGAPLHLADDVGDVQRSVG